MARILFCHPAQTTHPYHLYTDLDFWDARRLLKDIALVRRNFGQQVNGDEFPAQVILEDAARSRIAAVKKRLNKAIASPPRHVVVRSMIFEGFFEFDPLVYYPHRWDRDRMIRFTYRRLPLGQAALCSPYQTVQLSWRGQTIRVDRVQRLEKHDPVIQTDQEARQRLFVPTCF